MDKKKKQFQPPTFFFFFLRSTSLCGGCPSCATDLHSCSVWPRVFQKQWKFCFGNTAERANRKQEGLFQNPEGSTVSIFFFFLFWGVGGSVLQQQQDTSGEVKSKANTEQPQRATFRVTRRSSECAPGTPKKIKREMLSSPCSAAVLLTDGIKCCEGSEWDIFLYEHVAFVYCNFDF